MCVYIYTYMYIYMYLVIIYIYIDLDVVEALSYTSKPQARNTLGNRKCDGLCCRTGASFMPAFGRRCIPCEGPIGNMYFLYKGFRRSSLPSSHLFHGCTPH